MTTYNDQSSIESEEASSNTEPIKTIQVSIFRYIDVKRYGFRELDDMINGERTMMHYPSVVCDTAQSKLFG